MLLAFANTSVQMLRIALVVALGFALSKFGIFPKSFEEVVSKLITKLLMPMLTLYTFISNCTREKLAANGSLLLYGALLAAVALTASYLMCGLFEPGDAYRKNVMRYALAFPNTSAFLTPLAMAFVGMEGYFYSQLFLLPLTFVNYSWGILQLVPGGNKGENGSPGQILRKIITPNTAAMLLGMLLGIANAGSWLPGIVLTTIQDFGGCFSPMTLLLVGFSLADYPLRDVLPNRKTFAFILIRMLAMPAALLLLMKAIGAPYYAYYFAAAAFACPCGMNTVVYPIGHGRDCRFAISMVLFSSAASVIVIPIIYALIEAVI